VIPDHPCGFFVLQEHQEKESNRDPFFGMRKGIAEDCAGKIVTRPTKISE
jgi:hypothetical protein